ncbi:cilia- and flagella-associated protein 43-like [Colletes gigas]|uniref:cilia- and flagella-associated protein 43-like n=1 Tax=Colletes gigas TaxID=935657 RepID=UPI001C9B091F|nr:cilia- and flagella-associated protein 43-like [Colletes gigas]
MRFTSVEPSWAIFGKCREVAYVGRDAIVAVSGIYARFFDLRSGKTRIERFDDRERADGASCVAGHSVASIFSIVERKPNPRVLIFGYPSIRRITCCSNSQEANGYACCAFTGTEYLLGQTIYPDFRVIVWHWRTGDQMAAIDATITDLRSTILACCKDSPQLVARFEQGTSALSVYRILVCSKIVRLFPVDLEIDSSNKPVAISWSTGGTLLFCDESGNVWSVDLDESENHRARTIVQASFRSQRNPSLVTHKGGALVVEIPPETNRDVRATFYRKETKDRTENWRAIWTISLPSFPSWAQSHPRDDKILILGENGELFEVVGSLRKRGPRLEFLSSGSADFEAVASFSDQFLAALDLSHRLVVLDASTGNVVSATKRSLKHHGEVVRLISHPTAPILAACSATGNCVLVEVSAPSTPKIVCCVHLQREPLDRMNFSEEGRILGVGSSQNGRLFILVPTLDRRTTIKVACTIDVQRKVLDLLIYETKDNRGSKVLVLVGGLDSKDPRAGDEILVYSLDGDFFEAASNAIKLSCSFEKLFHGMEGSTEVFGAPYLSRQLHRIRFKANFGEAVVLDAVPSLHRTRNVQVGFDRVGTRDCSLLLTCGYDGLIVLRDTGEPQKVLAVFPGHHRSQGGVQWAAIVGDAVVSFGRNGDLVANKLRPPFEYLPGRSWSPDSFARWIPDESARRTTDEDEDEEDKMAEDWLAGTWVDAMARKRTMDEEKRDLSSRLSIVNDFNDLKRRVKALLDANEAESPDARLPISAFDLDAEARERKMAAARMREEQLIENTEELIAGNERAISYLRERFLEPLVVRPKSISSIFGESKVTNYPLVKVDQGEIDRRAWCRFSMETRELVSRFEEENSDAIQELEERNLFDPYRGYVDVLETCATAEERELDLKSGFNERFDETRSAKKNETKMAIERARNTRRCVDELKETFGVDASTDLLNVSRWREIGMADDRDDFDTDSSDSSLASLVVSPTVEKDSPGDVNFRLETLEQMMDGVLEIKLEDNAKRTIPKPECLELKDPSNYTEEDVAAIESYEKKIRTREAHRLEYKSTLETEIDRVKEKLSKGAKAFDDQLTELSAEKVRVERSVLLEKLSKFQKIIGHRTVARRRREILRTIDTEVVPATKQARSLAEECELFEAGVVELRNRYEGLRKRDKLLEAKFRAEFEAELKQPMVEHLFRHYRRRPRTAGAVCGTSLAFLAELAELAIGDRKEESAILPREWQDYLRNLDDLDAMPDNLPPRIDLGHWNNACRLRRLKVEAEIKVRSCAIELAEAEQSLAFYRKACLAARATVNRRKETVQRLEKSLIDLTDDQEVVLILKTGQLQKQPRGESTSEWEETVLITREELDRVREAIAEAGERKLAALQRVMRLGRTIAFEEWRHALVRKTMENLQENLKDLSTVKVSRMMRECVDRYPDGTIPKEELETLERDFLERQKRLVAAVEEERVKLQEIASATRKWQDRNAKLMEEIERSKTERDELRVAARDPLRSKAAAFKRKKMRSITRKARLARTIRENFEELLILHSQLEVSKLRTFPTLKLQV